MRFQPFSSYIHRGEEGQPQQFLVRATFSSFSRPRHLKILVFSILFFLSVLTDKTIFKESGHVRAKMKYRIFVNRKKSFNWIKVFKFNVLKNVHLFYAHFQIFLVQKAAKNSKFIKLQSFLLIIVKTIEFSRVVPWGKW